MRRRPKFHSAQRGAVLVVSLLLLLVMTVLALTASQSTRLQERMAGNARDLDLSFQAGEAGLREAEQRIDGTIKPKLTLRETVECVGDIQSCDSATRDGTAGLEFADQNVQWWADNAYASVDSLSEIDVAPHYYTELWQDLEDTPTIGHEAVMPKSGTKFYVNTSRAQGATDTAVTLIESAYAVRY